MPEVETPPQVTPRVAGPALFLLSSSLLAFEIALLRVFSIASYHHFAYMAVGVALLGFGASGTVLVLLRRATGGREWRIFPWLLALTPPALLAAPVLARVPGFDPTQLLWDSGQWWGLTVVYGALVLPFFLGAAAVAVALQGAGKRVGRLYAWNLAGSGAGALGILPLLHLSRPDGALAWAVVPATLAAAVMLLTSGPAPEPAPGPSGSRRTRMTAVLLLVALTVWAVARNPAPIPIIHFKGLPQVEAYPEARRVGEEWGPTGWAVAVEAPAFRHAPGLSLAYRGTFPDQVALFVDGEVAGTALKGVTDTETPTESLGFLDWLPTSTPYATRPPESVLILGSGGGMEVLNALAHGADRVTAVELVEPLVRISREAVSGSSSPYDDPRVSLVIGDARSFAARTKDRFSLVVLPVSGVFNATAAGIHSGGEDFLNTTEAYRSFLRILEPGGILSVTRWTRTPPRDNVRVILTAADALRPLVVPDVAGSLAFVRSWATGTLLVKPDGFKPRELESLRKFCETRYFDLDWPPSLDGPTSDFNRIAEPVYRDAVSAAAEGPASARAFDTSYPFQVGPSTDDHPYFGRFLRLRSTPAVLLGDRGEWLPFAEWGYLGVIATFIQSGVLALLLIAMPALVLRRRRAQARIPVFRPAIYFGGIGLGFILVEMAAIQRLSLILGHPVYAAAATLGALLVFSGLGSELSDRKADRWASFACLAVAGVSIILGVLSSTVGILSSFPLILRAIVALAGIGVLGVAMGLPFPLGLRRLARAEGGVAWAWAVNGVSSVLGASLAILLAMEVGGRMVFLAGAFCYLGAAGAAWKPRLPKPSAPWDRQK